MEKKNSIAKYMLIFEPIYVTHQYAVSFTNDGDVDVRRIQKYSDIPLDSKKPVKKNLLGDIDKFLTPLEDLSSFFKTYVNPNIFSYYGNNLHKMFIGYKYNGSMYTLNYVVNNSELNSRLSFVEGSKINDYLGKRKAINLILNSENDTFLMFMNNSFRNRQTNLSSVTVNIANQMKMASSMGSYHEYEELEMELEDRLTSYKEYREMFLLRQRYIEFLDEEKEKLKVIKEKTLKEEAKKEVVQPKEGFFGPVYTGEQLSFFDGYNGDTPKSLIKK